MDKNVEVLKVTEAAKRLDKSEATVYKLKNRGRLEGPAGGGIYATSLEAFREGRPGRVKKKVPTAATVTPKPSDEETLDDMTIAATLIGGRLVRVIRWPSAPV